MDSDVGYLSIDGQVVTLTGFGRIKNYICFSISPKRVYIIPGPIFHCDALHIQFSLNEERQFTDKEMAFFLQINEIAGIRYNWLDDRYVPYGYDKDIIL